MPYIGRGLEKGNYLKLDDISSQFDGSKTTFNLTVGGSAHVPGSSYSLLVSLSGIIQEGEAAYTLDQNQITFAAAPQAVDDCYIISLGTPIGIGVPGDGTVSGPQFAKPFNYENFFYLDHTTQRVGIGTTVPTQSLDVYDGNIAIRDPATASQFLGFYHNRNVLKASIDKTGNNLTFENVDSGIIDYKIGGDSRVSIGSTGKIFFGTDDNTYFYRPGADTLGFLTGGTERLRITSDGSLLIDTTVDTEASADGNDLIIGSTSDTQKGISIVGSTTNGVGNIFFTDGASYKNQGIIQYRHADDSMRFTTAQYEALRITSDGDVGIGTTNPGAPLHIHDDSPKIILKDTDNNAEVYLHNVGGAAVYSSIGDAVFQTPSTEIIRLAATGKVGIGTHTPTGLLHAQNNSVTDTKIIIESTGADSYPALRIKNDARDYDLGINGSNDSFRIYDVTGTEERFTITSGGLIKIDEASPVAGTNGENALLQVKSVSQYDGLLLGHGYEYGTIGRGAAGALTYTGNASPGNLGGTEKIMHDWWSGSAGGGGPNRLMVLTTSGNLGIGTSIPGKSLEIFGTDPTIKLRDSSGDAYALIEGDSADEGSIRFRADPLSAGADTHIRFDVDGTQRLRITGAGITVTGEVAASLDYPDFRPTVDFNFAAVKKLDSRIKYTRTGRASYYDEHGLLKIVNSNVPRFDHDPDTREPLGLLIEESRTNLIANSDAPGPQTANLGGAAQTNGTATTTVPTGEIGTVREFLGVASGGGIRFGDFSGTANTTYTGSVWVRTVSGTGAVTVDMNDGNVQSNIPISTKWKRLSSTHSTNNTYRFLDLFFDNPVTVYIWGLQIEEGPFMSSYIPTRGAAGTRGGDIVTVDNIEDEIGYNQHEGAVIMEYKYSVNSAGSNTLFAFSGTEADPGDSSVRQWLRINQSAGTPNTIRYIQNSNTSDSTATATEGILQKFAFAYEAGDQDVSLDGTSILDTARTPSTNIFRLSIGTIGWNLGLSTVQLKGHVKRFTYYPKKLPNSQLNTLTS